jgi:hypothetical protein
LNDARLAPIAGLPEPLRIHLDFDAEALDDAEPAGRPAHPDAPRHCRPQELNCWEIR